MFVLVYCLKYPNVTGDCGSSGQICGKAQGILFGSGRDQS